jgi:hypothetical protein
MIAYLAVWTGGIGAVDARAFATKELRDAVVQTPQKNQGAFGGWEPLDVEVEECRK